MEALGFIGAFWPSKTRYIEYQDGSFLTDAVFADKDRTEYADFYGNGNGEICLGPEGNIERCNGRGVALCEINLLKDTHVCLNKEFLASVSLKTELEVHSQVRISSANVFVNVLINHY